MEQENKYMHGQLVNSHPLCTQHAMPVSEALPQGHSALQAPPLGLHWKIRYVPGSVLGTGERELDDKQTKPLPSQRL